MADGVKRDLGRVIDLMERTPLAALELFGDSLLEFGHVEESLVVFDLILAEDPRNVFALTGTGEAMRRLGNVERARAALNDALSVRPRHAAALMSLAALEASAGNDRDALPLWNAAVEEDPFSEFARSGLQQTYRRLFPVRSWMYQIVNSYWLWALMALLIALGLAAI